MIEYVLMEFGRFLLYVMERELLGVFVARKGAVKTRLT